MGWSKYKVRTPNRIQKSGKFRLLMILVVSNDKIPEENFNKTGRPASLTKRFVINDKIIFEATAKLPRFPLLASNRAPK